jgi:hypothetical protein
VVGEQLFEQDMSEFWYGLTWSRALKPDLGFGATMFLAYRSQRTRAQTLFSTQVDSGQVAPPVATGIAVREVDYSHYRLLWKLGATWVSDRMIAGVAVTAPGIGIAGKGSLYVHDAVSGIDLDGDGPPEEWLTGDQQHEVTSDFRSPWAIAVGASFPLGNTTLHVTGEWYGAVGEFDVLQTTYQQPLFGGETETAKITHQLDSVINAGAGVEHAFSDRLTVYGSFNTDFSAANKESADIALSTWDIYHVSSGASFEVGQSELMLGFGYANGSDELPRQVGFLDTGIRDLLPDPAANVEVSYSQWRAVFGFSLFL